MKMFLQEYHIQTSEPACKMLYHLIAACAIAYLFGVLIEHELCKFKFSFLHMWNVEW